MQTATQTQSFSPKLTAIAQQISDSSPVLKGRPAILQALMSKTWFGNTSHQLQEELVGLPANHDGFLSDLSKRPERVSNVNVVSLNRLARANFALIPIFNVLSDAGKSFTYEYVSWRYGPESGAKGLLLVENADALVTHLVVLRGEKFATGKVENDIPGGFIDIGIDGVTELLDRVKVELKQELGIDAPALKEEPVIVGSLLPDGGMTNNRPKLFIAKIRGAMKIVTDHQNTDEFELKATSMIVPIAKLPELMRRNEDGFLAATVVQAIVQGFLPADCLVAKRVSAHQSALTALQPPVIQ